MPKLKLGIQRVGNIVFGKALEQDESLREKGLLYEDKKIAVRSAGGPELYHTDSDPSTLFIRGSVREADNNWFASSYSSESEAEKVVEAIKRAVAVINSNQTTDSQDCGLEIVE